LTLKKCSGILQKNFNKFDSLPLGLQINPGIMKKPSLLLTFVLACAVVFSQYFVQSEPSQSSPHHTLFTHLYFLQDESYRPDLSAGTIYAPEAGNQEKMELAEKMKKILDGKGFYIDINLVPQDSDYLDSVHQKHIYFISSLDQRIYLEKIGDKWYYSASTIGMIDELFKEVYPWGTEWISSVLPDNIGNKKFLNIRWWQWLGGLIVILVAIFGYWLVKVVTQWMVNTFFKIDFIAQSAQKEYVLNIAKAFSLFIAFFWTSRFIPALLFPPRLSYYVIKSTTILTIIFAAILAIRIAALVMQYFARMAEKTETKLDEQLVPIVDKLLRLGISIAAVVFCLKALEVDLVAILAGLSVGALALALAAQDTVKNFIGSITIFLDKPFEIGDFIEAGGVKGTVEEVGIRATRIRTPNQSLAYIPNGNLANMTVDNLGLRKYRRWQFEIGVIYGTPVNLLESYIRGCKEILDDYPYTMTDGNQVRLNNLGASSLNIHVNVFLDVKTWAEELRCKHEILVRFIELAEEKGVSFAFPTQSIHIESMPSAEAKS
jgi:MscS family membrane protein